MDKELSARYRRSFLGKMGWVLLEERKTVDGKEYMVGHTKEYVKAAVPFAEGLKNTMSEGMLSGMLTDEILLLS